MTALQNFSIDVPAQRVQRILAQLADKRWPAAPADASSPDPDWRYGTDVRWLRRLVEHWTGSYDWPAAQRQLNRWPQFIARIERSEKAFQRLLSKSKVRAIKNFYETAISQPPIPGTVLLFTPQKLRFDLLGHGTVGHLQEPGEKYLIIDGQHRLAALNFYERTHPDAQIGDNRRQRQNCPVAPGAQRVEERCR